MKLFIIGNGFDLAHNMNTKYSDFRKYLVSKYAITKKLLDNIWTDIPSPNMFPDGSEEYDDTLAAASIVRILDLTEGEKWGDVETTLGELEYGEFLDDWVYDYNLEDDREYRNMVYRNEDNARNLCGAIRLIVKYFQDWIQTIQISKNKIVDFEKLISKDDLFLNFNYTETLEVLYNAKNVCHIHGKIGGGEIFFGHGNNEDKTEIFQKKWFGADFELNQLEYELKKDTKNAYFNNLSFFMQIEKLFEFENPEIYSYGFSFSKVDRFYLREMFLNKDTKRATFFLSGYEDIKTRNEYIKTLEECGFKGKFSTFQINSFNKKLSIV